MVLLLYNFNNKIASHCKFDKIEHICKLYFLHLKAFNSIYGNGNVFEKIKSSCVHFS